MGDRNSTGLGISPDFLPLSPPQHKLARPKSQGQLRMSFAAPSPRSGSPFAGSKFKGYDRISEESPYSSRRGPTDSSTRPTDSSGMGITDYDKSPGGNGHGHYWSEEERAVRPPQHHHTTDPGPPLNQYGHTRQPSEIPPFIRASTSPNQSGRRASRFSPPTPSVGDTYQDGKRTSQPSSGDMGWMSRGGNQNSPFMPLDMAQFSVKTTGSTVFPSRPGGTRNRALSEGTAQLHRQGTLLTPLATSKRASAELGIMLGSSRKATKGRLLPQGELPIEEKLAKLDQVKLEAKKGNKARVEVDVILERNVMVEGGDVRGRLDIRVRRGKTGDGRVWVGGGKLRIVGYEDVPKGGGRHIFYHYPYALPDFAPYWTPEGQICSLFASDPNKEGYRIAAEGNHSIPFSFRLPLNGGAKGGWQGDGKGMAVKYVIVGSIKLHVPDKQTRAIAHFYRPAVVYPYIPPAIFHSSKSQPVESSTEKGLGWCMSGEKGIVQLKAKLSRASWVAGQRVWVQVTAMNGSNRKIVSSQVILLRDVTQYSAVSNRKHVFSWRSDSQESDPAAIAPPPDQFQPFTVRKKICEETMESSTSSGSGYVGAKGWWTGVEPGGQGTWECSLTIPANSLTMPRSRFMAVSYIIRLRINGSIHVDVPLNIVNHLSLDPPPSFGLSLPTPTPTMQSLLSPWLTNRAEAEKRRSMDVAIHAYDYAKAGNRQSIMSNFQNDRDAVRRPRPQSMQSYRSMMTDPHGHIDYTAYGDHKQRPRSRELHKAQSTSSIRHSSKRDTTMSYLSAVASIDETAEDLRLAEAHRRAGRQMSLAAIQQASHGDRKPSLMEEDEDEIGGPEYAPSHTPVSVTSEARIQDEDLEEVTHALDVISMEGEIHEMGSERDTESRHLEEILAPGSATFQSRFAASFMDGYNGSSPRSAWGGQSGGSHSVYDEQESPPYSVADESLNGRNRPNMQPMHVDVDRRLLRTPDAQVAGYPTPGRLGSIALSAFSGVSMEESELGQVQQAERRSIMPPNKRMPNMMTYSSTYMARNGSLPVTNDDKRKFLDVPRSNSLFAPVVGSGSRRPSAPTLFTEPPRAAPDSPGSQSLFSGRGPSRPPAVFNFGGAAGGKTPIRIRDEPRSPLSSSPGPLHTPERGDKSPRPVVVMSPSSRVMRDMAGLQQPSPSRVTRLNSGGQAAEINLDDIAEDSPGLDHSVAEDSVSSQSHSRASTPRSSGSHQSNGSRHLEIVDEPQRAASRARSRMEDRPRSSPAAPELSIVIPETNEEPASATGTYLEVMTSSPSGRRIISGPRERTPSMRSTPPTPSSAFEYSGHAYSPAVTEEDRRPSFERKPSLMDDRKPSFAAYETPPRASPSQYETPTRATPNSRRTHNTVLSAKRAAEEAHVLKQYNSPPAYSSQVRRQPSAASFNSVSTTATSIENALLRRKVSEGGHRSPVPEGRRVMGSRSWVNRVGEPAEDDDY